VSMCTHAHRDIFTRTNRCAHAQQCTWIKIKRAIWLPPPLRMHVTVKTISQLCMKKFFVKTASISLVGRGSGENEWLVRHEALGPLFVDGICWDARMSSTAAGLMQRGT